MKTLSTLLFSFILLFCISCKKNVDTVSRTVDITVLNQQGQNLLASPALYTKENINIYYVVNGQAQLYTGPNKGFFFSTDYNTTAAPWMRIDLNFDRKEKYPLTLIKFGNTKTDTIKAKFKITKHLIELQTIWFNGVQQSSNIFTITK